MSLEEIIVYLIATAFCGLTIYYYLRQIKQNSAVVAAKIELAKEEGLHEPISLHPVIDLGTCIQSGACIEACPEKDILGILMGGGTLIQASNCVGHGACFHACPTEAISLVIGTEKRGVDLPHVSETYETNVPGIYIAGELGGMGLIKNSVEQGKGAIENIIKKGILQNTNTLDVLIIGAGPAGIAASLNAKKHNLTFLTLEQDTIGGTVFTFPRSKIVMTAPMDLPLHGMVKLYDTSKEELISLWETVLKRNKVSIQEKTKVEAIIPFNNHFIVKTQQGDEYRAQNVLLAIGRRGTPRKLGISGEMTKKVAYRLLEPELIHQQKIMVVGGGDSAVEAALLLASQNEVILSYRKDKFSRIKPKNRTKILAAIEDGSIIMRYKTNLTRIEASQVWLSDEAGREQAIENDLVYIFIGGELPTQFLQKAGVKITKRFGYTVKRYA